MKKAVITITLLICAALSGCASLLEGRVEYVSEHISTPAPRPPVQQITVSNTDQLRELIFELILTYQELTTIQYQGTENENIGEEAVFIAEDILRTNPIADFAVSDIKITTTQIVTYYELIIEIDFQKTEDQIQSITDTSTQRYMMTQMLEIMSRYNEDAIFYTNLQLGSDEIENQVVEIYYQNPRRLVMMPFVTVETYGRGEETAEDAYRVYQIRFGYTEDTDTLRGMRDNLSSFVRINAGRADGDTDGEILLSLVQNLIAGAEYDEGTAGIIAMHGVQNIAATAFGALVRGNAVGEGFAMAFKALCDEMHLDCQVVLGFMGDTYHAWNIVNLDGHYYHIDAAMCALYGLEAGFLKSDEDFSQSYIWDTANTQKCDGPLTLQDLLPDDNTADTNNFSDPAGQTDDQSGDAEN